MLNQPSILIVTGIYAIAKKISDGVTKVKLTNTDKIKEMYPRWSSVDNEIVYNTTDGVIYKLKLKID